MSTDEPSQPVSKKPRVLLVDDSGQFRALLAKKLAEMEIVVVDKLEPEEYTIRPDGIPEALTVPKTPHLSMAPTNDFLARKGGHWGRGNRHRR